MAFSDINQDVPINDQTGGPGTLEQTVCLDNFCKKIQQDITVGCMLPMNIPKKEILRIITEAKKWFYKHYEYSVEARLYMILNGAWQTDSFKNTGVLTLPDNVFSVYGVYEVGSGAGPIITGSNGGDVDFALDKYIMGGLYQSDGGMAGIASENMMFYVVNNMFFDMARDLTISKMSYHYNELTHKLAFTGHRPKREVVIQIFKKIDDCSLFTDDYFYRWVIATTKYQMSRVLGSFNYNLPGNITINFDLIRSDGQDELTELKETIKSEEGTDWFFTGGLGI